MRYHVIWSENGKQRRVKFMLRKTAQMFLRGLIIDCHCYDAVLYYR